MRPLQLPALRLREPIGMPGRTQRSHDLGRDAGLFGDFTRGAACDALARLDMPLGQIPTSVAANHEPPPLRIGDHAAGSLHHREILSETGERSIRIGHDDRNRIAGFEKIHYLVTTYVPAINGRETKRLPAGSLPNEDDRLIGEPDNDTMFHNEKTCARNIMAARAYDMQK